MNRIEDLRSVSENTLHGLVADDSLKFRILQKASGETETRRGISFRTVPALCGVLAALIVMVFALNTLKAVPSAGPGEINVFAAGGAAQEIEPFFPAGVAPESFVSVELEGSFRTDDPEKCALFAGILAEKAEKAWPVEIEGDIHLILSASDGTVLTYHVCNPYLIGDDGRVWSCPDLFSSLAKEKK